MVLLEEVDKMIVTDVKYRDKMGVLREGYYLDNYLVENLAPTSKFLATDRDVVIIISGQGQVRSGKTTIGAGIGYFLAWMQSGGRMDLSKDENGKYLNPVVIKKPTKPVRFGLENFSYTPDDLIKNSEVQHAKYGKGQVLFYDECSGLDSAGTMKRVNQQLQEFFQTVGARNHIIIIVLPDFFQLNQSIATTRSMFLVDVFSDENWKRGFFNFYAAKDKEWLYFNGKKRIGIGARYASQNPTFWGTFRDWLPFDKEEYEREKQKKLKTRVFGSREEQTREKYMGTLHLLKTNTTLTTKQIAEQLSQALYREITPTALEHDHRNYLRFDKKHQKGGTVV